MATGFRSTSLVPDQYERWRADAASALGAKLQASSKEIHDSKIGADETKLFTEPKGEHRNFLDCVKSRKDPYFPVDIGHRVSSICHLANIAIDRGVKLKWDPVKEKFTGDDAANAMCKIREGRGQWKIA